MTRFMLTVATTALVPTLALAESHAAGDTMDPAKDPVPMEQTDAPEVTDTADPMAPDADPMATDMAEDADPVAPKMDTDKMADTGHAADHSIGLMSSTKASVIIGAPIYTLAAEEQVDWDPTVDYNTVADEWTRIGSIDDFVLGEDGKISGLVAEVGGFLGMGDTLVLLPLDQTRMVSVDEVSYAVVTPYTSEQLTEMEKVE
ncbi:PRC-barrel domain-containing protein [Antarctobacter heliothermus]|uniref:PRC-barrel domain-containing protein n=1 Tax=Antarctobacter heliothermus TaxID=74033 RepID=A0A239AY25_9RHOB|nr:PRC-barrel domain-containing protein [Antarctobacter heliothermus]SNS00527.1 PRC-barrel domain-containing protein [Antarctobacter heliothermus]